MRRPNNLFMLVIAAAMLFAGHVTAFGQIYLLNGGAGVVGEYNFDGTPINTSLITGAGGSGDMVVSGSAIYVVNESGNSVGEFNLNTGAAINANLITYPTGTSPSGIAISGSHLFITTSGPQGPTDPGAVGTVGEFNLDGSVVNANLITGLDRPTSILISGAQMFVVNKAENSTVVAGSVGEYNLAGTAVNASLISGLNAPSGIVLSGQNLFISSGQPSDDNGLGSNPNNSVGEYNAITGATVNDALITGLSDPLRLALLGDDLLVMNIGNSTSGPFIGQVGEYGLDGSTVNADLISDPGAGNILVVGSVPEPSDYAALAALAALGIATLQRRHTKKRLR